MGSNSPGLGKGHPQDQDKLEGVVEGEPVDGANHALKDAGDVVSAEKPQSEQGKTYVKKAKVTQY